MPHSCTMKVVNTYRTPAHVIRLSESESVPADVQLFRVGTFSHEKYGTFAITPKILSEMQKNFKSGVRGIDLAIDYKHANDDIAAAWIKDVYLSEDGNELWAKVDWTPKGKTVVGEKEFRYISPEFTLAYEDNETHAKFGPTLLGAGLTNRPTIKKMEPVIELTEVVKAAGSDGARWVTVADEKTCQMCLDLDGKTLSELDGKRPPLHENCRCSMSGGEASESVKASAPKEQEQISKGKSPSPGLKPQTSNPQKGIKAMDVSKMEPAAIDSMEPEALKALAKELLAMCQQSQMEMAKLKEGQAKAVEEKKMSERRVAFAKLLTEGKACKAQEEAFLAGDMAKFAELHVNVKLSESGGSTETTTDPVKVEGSEQAQDEVLKQAKIKLSEKKAKTIGEAISMVLSEQPDLNKTIYG